MNPRPAQDQGPRSRIPRDALRRTSNFKSRRPPASPKFARKMASIVKCSINLIARTGAENLSLAKVARDLGLTAPAIRYYFGDINTLLQYSLAQIIENQQLRAINQMALKNGALQILEEYLRCTLQWGSVAPTELRAWHAFFKKSGTDSAYQKVLLEWLALEQDRLQAIIDLGVSEGRFACAHPQIQAKVIQFTLCGALVHSVLNPNEPDRKFNEILIDQCTKLAGKI